MSPPSGQSTNAAPYSGRSGLESALMRDRWITLASLAAIVLLCWSWILPMARDMYGAMNASAAWMMTPTWDLTHILLLLAMWIVMMIGMMLPSAAPTLLLYGIVVRTSKDASSPATRVHLFALGYLLVWTVFAALATALQLLLGQLLLLSPMMESSSPVLTAALLLLAGVYQLTPFKRTCLESCRSPVSFITAHWHAGNAGALGMGIQHGLYCLGCCWALMLLLFAGGVMNLLAIGAITLVVLIEKVAPRGAQAGRLSGVALLALGGWMILSKSTQIH